MTEHRGFLAELKRRNVIRMAGLYLVGAWLVVQVASTILPMFDAPAWLPRTIVVLAAIGFLPALVFSWVFELTSEGIKRESEVDHDASIAPQTGRRMDRAIIGVLALVLAVFAADRFLLAPSREARDIAAAVAQARVGVESDKSIAVLPFDDLSPAHDQGYFSDGVAEELLDALAKVKDVKVAGRYSSFAFRGRNAPLASIGQSLGVATVLEGSVRKQGDRVRISAHLTRIRDNRELWADSFDGDLKDVFALQERIARAIADKLQLLLNGKQATQLVDTGTSNPEAFQLYLQATLVFNRRDGAQFANAIDALQRAVALDPHYARAYARLASLYVVLPAYTVADPRQAQAQAMRYAEAALAIDPDSAEAYAAQGVSLDRFRETQVAARDAFEQAMRKNPNDSTASFWHGLNLLKAGYRQRGTAEIDHALALDATYPNALRWRGLLYLQDGDVAHAEPLLQRARSLGLLTSDEALAEIAVTRGDAAAAERLRMETARAQNFGFGYDDYLTVLRGIHGDPAAKRNAVQMLQRLIARPGTFVSSQTTFYLFRLDEPTLGLAVLHERDQGDNADALNWIWTRQGAPIRALPEFQAFLRDYHFPELWDKYGPPDLCRKGADGHYTCN